jgi:hypothetical protein
VYRYFSSDFVKVLSSSFNLEQLSGHKQIHEVPSDSTRTNGIAIKKSKRRLLKRSFEKLKLNTAQKVTC